MHQQANFLEVGGQGRNPAPNAGAHPKLAISVLVGEIVMVEEQAEALKVHSV
jgi:hypothetical protein